MNIHIKEHLQTIFNSLNEAYLVLDSSGNLLWINNYADRTYEQLFGGRFKLNEPLFNHFSGYLYDLVKGTFDRSISTNQVAEECAEVISINDTKFWYLISFTPINSENGEFIGVIMQGRDVTELKEAEVKLQLQKETLSDIARIQSHILRRPLANILGLTQIIRVTDNPSEIKEVVEKLIQSVDELDAEVKKIVSETSLGDHVY